MKTYSLLIGARDGQRRFAKRDDALIQEITLRVFRVGFTILSAEGAWYDPAARKFVKQEARQVMVCTSSATKIRSWCQALKKALGQKELIVITLGKATRFVN